MASLKTKFTVGLFIAIGLAITIVAIIWLGMSKYLEEGRLYVAYFDESVQGLGKDSQVKYRGVPIGRVQSIGVAPDGTLVQVIMKIESELELEDLKKGIVAQLKSIGITGIMFLELDRRKAHEPDLSPKPSFKTRYPVIATKPSDIKKILKGVDDILKLFKKMDTKGITNSLQSTLQKINRVVDDIRMKEISGDIQSSLSRINSILAKSKWDKIIATVESAALSADTLMSNARDTVKRLDRMVASNQKGVETAVTNANGVIKNANKTVNQFQQILMDNQGEFTQAISTFNKAVNKAEDFMTAGFDLMQKGDRKLSDFTQNLVIILQNLEIASENLNGFIETIADQPSQLLFGGPPPEKQTAPGTSEK